MTKYPECEKMAKVQPQSQIIGEFLEWLSSEKGCFIGAYKECVFTPIRESTEKLLSEFFDIDLAQVEHEKCQMLLEIRKVYEEGRVDLSG